MRLVGILREILVGLWSRPMETLACATAGMLCVGPLIFGSSSSSSSLLPDSGATAATAATLSASTIAIACCGGLVATLLSWSKKKHDSRLLGFFACLAGTANGAVCVLTSGSSPHRLFGPASAAAAGILVSAAVASHAANLYRHKRWHHGGGGVGAKAMLQQDRTQAVGVNDGGIEIAACVFLGAASAIHFGGCGSAPSDSFGISSTTNSSSSGSNSAVGAILGAIIGALTSSVILDHVRWQQFPLFVVTISILAINTISPQQPAASSSSWWWWQYLIAASAAGFSWLLCALMPVAILPTPSGPFRVGSCPFHLRTRRGRVNKVFEGREEEPRDIVGQVWYPTASADSVEEDDNKSDSGVEQPLWDAMHHRAGATAELFGFKPPLSTLLMLHLFVSTRHSRGELRPLVHSGSKSDKNKKMPVVLFSHGFTGHRFTNVALCEELASHGMVVVALEHVYDSCAAILPSGEFRRFEAKFDYQLAPGTDYLALRQLQLEVRKDDMMEVLDALQKGGFDDPCQALRDLEGCVRLDRVAFAGHSFGAATAASCIFENKGIARCMLGLDCWAFPLPSSAPLGCPALFLSSPIFQTEQGRAKINGIVAFDSENSKHIFMEGAAHQEFTDAPYIQPVLGLIIGVTKSANPRRTCDEVIQRSTEFLKKHLFS